MRCSPSSEVWSFSNSRIELRGPSYPHELLFRRPSEPCKLSWSSCPPYPHKLFICRPSYPRELARGSSLSNAHIHLLFIRRRSSYSCVELRRTAESGVHISGRPRVPCIDVIFLRISIICRPSNAGINARGGRSSPNSGVHARLRAWRWPAYPHKSLLGPWVAGVCGCGQCAAQPHKLHFPIRSGWSNMRKIQNGAVKFQII